MYVNNQQLIELILAPLEVVLSESMTLFNPQSSILLFVMVFPLIDVSFRVYPLMSLDICVLNYSTLTFYSEYLELYFWQVRFNLKVELCSP